MASLSHHYESLSGSPPLILLTGLQRNFEGPVPGNLTMIEKGGMACNKHMEIDRKSSYQQCTSSALCSCGEGYADEGIRWGADLLTQMLKQGILWL